MLDESSTTVDVALFPIPDCILFPGMIMPLHVFEPRYRAMVKHCVENHLPLAVAHTQKVVSPQKPNQSLEEALNSNQATYKPQQIFSAGRCELIETFDDGRMRINVHGETRVAFLEEIQTLPFMIARCEKLKDETSREEEDTFYKNEILKCIMGLASSEPALFAEFSQAHWREKSAAEFSFHIFQFIRLPSDIQQSILESTSSTERLKIILDVLNQAKRPPSNP